MERKIHMIWLETISIRAAGIIEAEKVLDIWNQFHLSTACDKLLEMTIFRNVKYATDISIHLQWKSNPGNESILGRQLSSELENHGLISHTIWIQEEQPDCDRVVQQSSRLQVGAKL